MVARDRPDDYDAQLRDIIDRLRRLEAGANLGYSSISRGQLRVSSNEGVLIQGSIKVEGFSIITGTERVIGTLEVLGDLIASGTISLTGPLTQTGPSTFVGDIDITGNLHIDGTTTLTKTMTVNSPGKIVVAGGPSPLTLESGEMSFGTGGKIDGTSGLRAYVSGGGFLSLQGGIAQLSLGSKLITISSVQTTVTGGLAADTLSVSGAKTFRMLHPTKTGKYLTHGSTESPVSGIEYWGDETLDDDGTALVELPAYFEDLAKPTNRVVFCTGRGFLPDWDDIEAGSFLVTGKPGGRFSWQVKAERFGGDFEVEPDIEFEPEILVPTD